MPYGTPPWFMLVLLTPTWKMEKKATRIRRRMSVDIFSHFDKPPVWVLSTSVLSSGILSVISLSPFMRNSVRRRPDSMSYVIMS